MRSKLNRRLIQGLFTTTLALMFLVICRMALTGGIGRKTTSAADLVLGVTFSVFALVLAGVMYFQSEHHQK